MQLARRGMCVCARDVCVCARGAERGGRRGQALSQATEMVEEMRAEWEANGVIEVAKAREEGERKARGLQQQLLAAREQLLAQQRCARALSCTHRSARGAETGRGQGVCGGGGGEGGAGAGGGALAAPAAAR